MEDLTADLYDSHLDTLVRAYDLACPAPYVIVAKDNLAQAVTLMETREDEIVAVLDNIQDRHVVGVLHKTDVLAAFNRLLLDSEEELRGMK